MQDEEERRKSEAKGECETEGSQEPRNDHIRKRGRKGLE